MAMNHVVTPYKRRVQFHTSVNLFRLEKILLFFNFYRCIVNFEIYVVHTPTNALFIK